MDNLFAINIFKNLVKEKNELSKFYSHIDDLYQRQTYKCRICGCECKSLCTSHSLPKFVLRGMTKSGIVNLFTLIATKTIME